MKLKLSYFFLMAVLMAVVVPVVAQNPIDVIEQVKSSETFSDLIGMDGLILTALITIAGYLSPFVPFLKDIPNTTFRVLTFAVIIIAGALLFGFASIWQGLISYFFSTSIYDIVLKWFIKTKEPG